MKIVLASMSPRRKQLLETVGITAIVVPADIDEEQVASACSDPSEVARMLAHEKVRAVSAAYPGSLVLGADTLVFIGGKILGKPRDEEEAKQMLKTLSGNTHAVYTGVALYNPRSRTIETDVDCTYVTMKALDDEEIDAYVRTGEPMDKAGSYALQGLGGMFVTRVEGDYTSVIGLPVPKVYGLLKKTGLTFADIIASEG